ncbi:LPS-assembly protein LptD [Rickettsiales endosymbiont of Stachyamoeba lipophora]|uniref:LPS-assembly protein LptD n=1 Tax=Rickettsiales endosymbiont of Stachyamoeba lipophora TaxID=2486578 RepID=UPI000F64EB84|nr:LPS assembly protein LptD [Rickettsiales endosymbiont of Stachyamoeba lipophora]AZL15519.1 LPS-assembly protein LptD [Rickettsiales endosymbiont of Stachyamoeba lipophora]
MNRFVKYLLKTLLLCTVFNKSIMALPDDKITINADKIEHDSQSDITTATGRVEIAYEGRILIADKVIYYKNSDSAYAIGNVTLLDEKGNIAFANKVILTDKLTKGLVKAIEIRLANNGYLRAKSAIKTNAEDTIFYDGKYTACKCNGFGPMWQINSKKSLVLNKGETLKHYNAWFEIYHAPIFYIPYISHHGPKAQRRSGFLVPKYAHGTQLGWSVKVPYYFNIAPNKDLITSIQYFSMEEPVLFNHGRWLTPLGKIELRQSITNPKKDPEFPKKRFKGHVNLIGDLKFENDWNAFFAFYKAHDKTYLKKYYIDNSASYLTTQFSLDKLDRFNRYQVHSFKYQDLAEFRRDYPAVLPFVDLQQRHEINDRHYLTNNFNALNLMRKDGVDVVRFVNDVQLHSPYKLDSGLLVKFTNSFRVDFYHVNRMNKPYSTTNEKINATLGRVVPQTAVDLSYPLSNDKMVITPLLNLVYSPYGNNDLRIANEDSSNIELNDSNLLKHNHYPGFDRVEGGFRAIYGINTDFRINNYYTGVMIGQLYRKRDRRLSAVSGLSRNSSDYVGRIYFKPHDNIDMFYRFRLDQHNFQWHRNELELISDLNPVHMTVRYNALDQKEEIALRKQKSVSLEGAYDLTKSLAITGEAHKILTKRTISQNRGLVRAGGGFNFNGDCIISSFNIARDFTRDRDKKPETLLMFKLQFKTIND